jgi:hypothetical protein
MLGYYILIFQVDNKAQVQSTRVIGVDILALFIELLVHHMPKATRGTSAKWERKSFLRWIHAQKNQVEEMTSMKSLTGM